MTWKRWIAACAALACLGLAVGAVFLVKNVPGAARLIYGDPPTATPPPAAVVPTLAPAGAAGWIAFETKRGERGDFEIYAVAPDGTRLVNVTNSWADDAAPAWSPDGRQIAFVSLRGTLTGKGELGKGSIYAIAFDPVAGRPAGEARRITDGGDDGWPAWSPGGRRLAFHSNRSGDWEIWVVNADGSNPVNLTNSPGEDKFPAWSPDGTRIAFTSKREGNYDVWLMNADGSNPANLTRSPGRDRYPTWSPDGRLLAFNTARDGNQEIYLMNADGSDQRNLSRTPDNIEGLVSWAPDGRRVVLYSDLPGAKDLFVVDLSTGKWTDITNHPASDEYCAWSPYSPPR